MLDQQLPQPMIPQGQDAPAQDIPVEEKIANLQSVLELLDTNPEIFEQLGGADLVREMVLKTLSELGAE